MTATNLRVLEIDQSVLPDGWTLSRLSEVCRINPPKASPDSLEPNEPVTFVPMPAVDADKGAITTAQERPFSEVRRGFTSFQDDDVIMAKITPCMENGKAAIASGLVNGLGFGSTEFHVLRSNGAVLPQLIYHFVRQASFRRAAEAEMTGSVGQKRVPVAFLEQSHLPLPPLSEQRRIVEKIEVLLNRVSAVRDRLARVPAIVKKFRQAVLAAACSGRLTSEWRESNPDVEEGSALISRIRDSHQKANVGHGGQAATPTENVHNLTRAELPETWVVETLQFLCEPGRSITYGILKPGPNQPSGVPYIRVADFPNDRLNPNGIRKTTLKIADQYRRSALRAGDLLLSIRGTVGRVCRVPSELAGANITQDTARITVNSEMSADYVEMYLRCPSTQRRLEAAMKGVAVRGVNIGDVRALQVAVPPRQEQSEIARRVEALFKLTDGIERRVEAATARAEKLTQAVLGKAFGGELVPTEAELARSEGRTYESASDLLARIQSERPGLIERAGARRKNGKRQRKRQMA
jgi:type I restriction enzyme, S subunit